MIRNFICLIILLVFITSCIFHKRVVFAEGGGVFIDTIDSSLKQDGRIVRLGQTIGVAFPAEYSKKRFANSSEKKIFFTPDTDLIKRIDKEANDQYCNAQERHDEIYFGKGLHRTKPDSLNTILSNEEKESIDKLSMYDCLFWLKNYVYYDKQYIGYTNVSGEKIIWIKLIDFREDPHKLKQYLTTSWIDGWHGWFYSNVREMYYHVNKNLITIEEDF